MDYLRGLLGIAVLIGFAYLFSSNRKAIDWRLVGIGLVLQAVFGFLITKVSFVASIFGWVSEKFVIFFLLFDFFLAKNVSCNLLALKN